MEFNYYVSILATCISSVILILVIVVTSKSINKTMKNYLNAQNKEIADIIEEKIGAYNKSN